MVTFAALNLAFAEPVVLRTDTNTTDEYDTSDAVAWLEYPECAITVLTPEAAQLPLTIDFLYVFFASNTGNDNGVDSLAEVGVQVLADGEEPSASAPYAWGPEEFQITFASDQLNEFHLVDETNGLYAIDFTEGNLAVWVCTPDPTTGEAWPNHSASDQSGVVIDTDSPSAGNYVFTSNSVHTLQSLGARGSWIIRAGASNGTEGDADTDSDADSDADSDTDTDTDGIAISGITPASTDAGVTADISITGSGFADGDTVFIGGLAVSNTVVVGESAITATSPASLDPGTYDVVVNGPDGETDTLAQAFTVEGGGCGCGTGGSAGLVGVLIGVGVVVGRRR